MPGVIATLPKLQFSSLTGDPLAGGTLDVYLAGTTTRTHTWQDSALSSLNTNPVVLDSRGACVIWLDSTKTYKLVLKNAAGVSQWTQDNIIGGGVSTSVELAAPAIEAARVESAASAAAAAASAALGAGFQLAGEIAAANSRMNVRGAWATSTAYALKDLYASGGVTYVVTLAHTSTTVAADLASSKLGVHQGATREELAAPDGANLLGWIQTGSGAVARTSRNKHRESISIKDFGADPAFTAATNSAAINAALISGHKRVGVPDDGVYLVNVTLTMPTGVTLHGMKGKGRLKLADGAFTNNGAVIVASDTTGASVLDIVVDCNQVNNAGQVSGISATDAIKYTVEGCEVLDSWYGIRTTGGRTLRIRNNVVDVCKAYGISCKLNSTTASCYDIKITGNDVSRCASGAVAGAGVDGQGIIVYGATGTTLAAYKNITGVVVSGNACLDNGAHGITLIAVSNFTVVGNHCSGHVLNTDFGSGICVSESCTGGTVTGNTCNDNYDAGILLDVVDQTGVRFPYGRMTVSNNTCERNTRAGIKVNSMPRTVISGNNCAYSIWGIFAAHGAYNNITSNNISFCTQNGIWLSGTPGPVAPDQTDMLLAHNIITNCTTAGGKR